MASYRNEVANDLQEFLRFAGMDSTSPVKETETTGKSLYALSFKNARVVNGMIKVYSPRNIQVIDDSGKPKGFDDFFEARRYLTSRYVE